jgi:general secretion pathway protein L
MMSRVLNWWTEGLATALLDLETSFRRPRRFRLDAKTRPYALHPLDGPRGAIAASIEIPEPVSGDLLSKIRQQTRGNVIEVVVPSAAILERRLEPLPKESQPYVESVVRHQIETIFPWNASDVVHATLIQDRSDGKIDVTVRATARSAIGPALSIATACEAGEIVLIGDTTDRDGPGGTTIPLSAGEAFAKIGRARAVARYAVIALLVSALGTIGWTTFTYWSVASDLAAVEQAIASKRAVLLRTSASRNAAGRGGIEARKLLGPVAVMVLEQLSELLPDDTYLTDMSLDGGRLRISGVSSQAAELVPLMEKSGHFRNASFYAPTTRIPGQLSDRFSIEAVVAPNLQAKP